MQKLLFITPHLSTGGLPQFLLKKIKSLLGFYEIHCVEYNDVTGGVLVVQRTQIKDICNDKFYTLDDDKNKLIDLINKISPDIIHFEEMPEYFMDINLAINIYKTERQYLIVETSHDSSFNSNNKRVFPDQFIFVSEYQKKNVLDLQIKSDVIEYPISVKKRKNRSDGLKFLGLDVNKKHIFNVGLFTPRKNQSEFIEYARLLQQENIQFHCIGNMADNFKYYWEPLLKELPHNVKIWGERTDVDNFYSCMDLFLFTSRGHSSDKETAPIVIKESIGYNVPTLLYNLPVYIDRYNCYDNVSYLDEVDKNYNINLIKHKLGLIELPKKENIESVVNSLDTIKCDIKDTIVVISTYPTYKLLEDITLDCIIQIKKAGYKVILTSHCPISKELQNSVDYFIYDKNNPLIKHTYYNHWFYKDDTRDVRIEFQPNELNSYHGLAVVLNHYNGISLANRLGYKNVIFLNYDMCISDADFNQLVFIEEQLKTKKAFFFYSTDTEGDRVYTTVFAVDTNFYLSIFEYFSTESYTKFVADNGKSVSLEQVYYKKLENNMNDIFIDRINNDVSFFKNSKICLVSMVEYLTVLRVQNSNKFVVFSYFNNGVDDKYNIMIIKKDGITIRDVKYEIKHAGWHYVECEYECGCVYESENLVFDKNNVLLKSYKKIFTNLDELDINGYFKYN